MRFNELYISGHCQRTSRFVLVTSNSMDPTGAVDGERPGSQDRTRMPSGAVLKARAKQGYAYVTSKKEQIKVR